MPNVILDEVFVASGASIWAWVNVAALPTANLADTDFVAWEPYPFFADPLRDRSFSYSTTQVAISGNQVSFQKLITNTGAEFTSFVFLYSNLP